MAETAHGRTGYAAAVGAGALIVVGGALLGLSWAWQRVVESARAIAAMEQAVGDYRAVESAYESWRRRFEAFVMDPAVEELAVPVSVEQAPFADRLREPSRLPLVREIPEVRRLLEQAYEPLDEAFEAARRIRHVFSGLDPEVYPLSRALELELQSMREPLAAACEGNDWEALAGLHERVTSLLPEWTALGQPVALDRSAAHEVGGPPLMGVVFWVEILDGRLAAVAAEVEAGNLEEAERLTRNVDELGDDWPLPRVVEQALFVAGQSNEVFLGLWQDHQEALRIYRDEFVPAVEAVDEALRKVEAQISDKRMAPYGVAQRREQFANRLSLGVSVAAVLAVFAMMVVAGRKQDAGA